MKGLSLSSLIICSLRTAAVVAKCYYPNGKEATSDYPCDPDADDSPCCAGGDGWACLSNKLCEPPDGGNVRGSCTDVNWDRQKCAHYCMEANRGGTNLVSCTNVTGNEASYCCDGKPNCCERGVDRFEINAGGKEAWATWDRASTRFVVVRQTSSASSATTATISTTPVSTEGPAPTQGDTQEDPGPSTAAKAGVGVGVAVGALLIAAILFLLLKVRRNKRALQAQQTQQEGGAPPRSNEDKAPPLVSSENHEMDAPPASANYEMDTQQRPRAELPANN